MVSEITLTPEQRRIALQVLQGGQSLDELSAAGAGTPESLRAILRAYLVEKATLGPRSVQTRVRGTAEIVRDTRGVPHIRADDPYDLFFALGYAQAQDRLWQLDYLRRQARGRLSEVFGPSTLDADVLARTLNISGMADRMVDGLSADSKSAVEAFAAGVNAWLTLLPAGLPAEFEALEYEPEPWQPADCLAIVRRWWWYLTGRLHVLTTPEAVRATVGDGERYAAFFAPDAPVTYIVPSGSYDSEPRWPDLPADPIERQFAGVPDPVGSNNWAAAPAITQDGHALLASDPHVYYTVPAEWYEMHLHGAGFDVAGAGYPAMPGVLIGRNQHLAWGVTNNICSLRDLYIEEVNPANPDEYRDGDTWTRFATRHETIAIRGQEPVQLTVRYAHGRPVVDHLVPEEALPRKLWGDGRADHTVLSLAWAGFWPSDEVQCLLDLGRAGTVNAGREALRRWTCPTLNFVLADTSGAIAYQCTGAIPLRGRQWRGYRWANNPQDAWQRTIPFDRLPRLVNPERGWVASANNPTAPPDFPYPLSGTWSPEDRAPRAEHLLATRQPHTLATFVAMQTDVFSGRAARGVPGLLRALGAPAEGLAATAVDHLRSWDHRLTKTSVGGAIFYVFFWRWHQRVVRERFSPERAPLVQDSGWGLSSDLLHRNVADWFASEDARETAIREAFGEALAWLAEKLGPDPAGWEWGRLHRLGASHPAARTPLQREMFDIAPRPHQGGAGTLANAFYTPPGTFDTRLGANYRFLAKLGPGMEMLAVCWPGASGQPGSPHYADQVEPYLADQYAPVPLAWADVEAAAEHRIVLTPAQSSG